MDNSVVEPLPSHLACGVDHTFFFVFIDKTIMAEAIENFRVAVDDRILPRSYVCGVLCDLRF